jgi:hypothetical protein
VVAVASMTIPRVSGISPSSPTQCSATTRKPVAASSATTTISPTPRYWPTQMAELFRRAGGPAGGMEHGEHHRVIDVGGREHHRRGRYRIRDPVDHL